MATVVLTDIEGTIGDVAFVRRVLFPYARDALAAFVADRGDEPAVARELAAAAHEAGLDPADRGGVVALLQRWIDEDRKATPLKALQGMIWREGYERGAFTAHLYADAHAWLAARRAAGVPLYVYSSGSVEAQHLYFAHSAFGDLLGWFAGFFDTRVGAKREVSSYERIAERIGADVGEPPAAIAFFSDVVAELDAAVEAGLRTVLVDRDGSAEKGRHPHHRSFATIDLAAL